MIKNKLLILILILSSITFAQNEKVRIVGKSLKGKEINGKRVREVIDNVIINHGKTKITCDKAIQYLDLNEIELLGNVIVVKDSVNIFTERGFYKGNEEIAYSENSLLLDDGKVILTAQKGYYYLNENKAEFFKNVSMFDSKSKLFAQNLLYWRETEKAIATGDVKLADTSSIVFADSVISNKKSNDVFAYRNVQVVNKENELNVFGQYLEYKNEEKYSLVLGKPVLMQIDTTDNDVIDTLMIKSAKMEMFSDSVNNKLVATDSVEIIRGDFLSKNDRTVYYRGENRIYTVKSNTDYSNQPVMWFNDTQLSGDTINVYIKENNIDHINIENESFILSTFPEYDFRFNQISGDSVKIFFEGNNITRTDVLGKVLSIYYMFEDDEANGLIKSSAERARIIFEDNNIDEVKFYISVENEFHPETVIKNKERDFTLPMFKLVEDKPIREKFFNRIKTKLK